VATFHPLDVDDFAAEHFDGDLEAAGNGDEITGKFFPSPPKKMTGPLVEIHNDHLDNPAAQQALMNVTAKATSQRGSRR
jgi:hypothetical protein